MIGKFAIRLRLALIMKIFMIFIAVAMPWGLALGGVMEEGKLGEILLGDNYSSVTQRYGVYNSSGVIGRRNDNGNGVYITGPSYHPGIDYSAIFVPVYSPVKGAVSSSDKSNGRLSIKIDEGKGYFILLHLDGFCLDKGDRVDVGQQIGLSGKAGTKDPHLHVELRSDSDISSYYFKEKEIAGDHKDPAELMNSIVKYKKCEFLIFPQYEEAWSFSSGLGAVKIGGKWGFIDIDGTYVIDPIFEVASDFSCGLAPVRINGMWGYVNKSAELSIAPIFEYASEYKNGYAWVIVNDTAGSPKWGTINTKGEYVIKPQYDGMYDFYDGLAIVNVVGSMGIGDDRIVSTGGKLGYVDKQGRIAIKPKYDVAGNFHEGLAFVKERDKFGYIDKSGEVVIKPVYEDARSFHEGLAAVKIDGKYGYIDKSGLLRIKPAYLFAGDFYDGLASVDKGGKKGYINARGEIVVDIKYEGASNFLCGVGAVKVNGKWGFIDQSGGVIVEANYDSIDILPFSRYGGMFKKLIAVKIGDLWGYVML